MERRREDGRKRREKGSTKEGSERKGCRGEKQEGTRDMECGEGKKEQRNKDGEKSGKISLVT
jgi:hypothetical protein